jgi:D-serine deaminase-like pyridoxal phosphate-dependent protein
MATAKFMVGAFAWDERYQVSAADELLTPALVLYPEMVARNIDFTLRLLGGDAERCRVHVKTSKLGFTLRMLVERGVHNFKCATTLELLTACESGASDVLVAYPTVGANARRVREIAGAFPSVRVSVLAENDEQIWQWQPTSERATGKPIGIFLDINPGMNRTGVEQSHGEEVVRLARTVRDAGLEFRGLHYYDGQYGAVEESERMVAAHAGYKQLLGIVGEIEKSGAGVAEVITAGTPTLPCSLAYEGFRGQSFVHRVSPGTVIYNDATSLAQLPSDWFSEKDGGYTPAALVMTRVVSRPHAGMITSDAGHKAVSSDAGVPTCVVVGHQELTPLAPSEEHLPMAIAEGAAGPQVGEVLYLLPRHVCPSVNLFDYALLARDGAIQSVQKVSARGREGPLLGALARGAME